LLSFALLLLLCAAIIYGAQDRSRGRALLSARLVDLRDLARLPNGATVAVRGPLGGERLAGPLTGRRCVWWAATGVDPAGGWGISPSVLRLGDAGLLDPTLLRTYDVHACGEAHTQTARAGSAVEYALAEGELLTVVGRVQHTADGLSELLPPRGQRHVRLYRHAPRVARARLRAREAAAWGVTVVSLALTLAA
jgi:hypothetical protein